MKLLLIIIKILNYLILIFIWGFTVFNFFSLPDIIPTHFGFNGKADAYGSRNSLWMLPVISTVLFLALNYLSKNPHSPLLNIPDSMRDDKKGAEFFVTVMQFFLVLTFASLIHETIQVTNQGTDEISNRTLYILGAMFVCMFGMLLSKKKTKTV
ncbi:DUF1648 domain-containing protein [Chryseobacterium sp.]|uniref:DUF1648 domain-containing protein n=1 Tax=Chryseobacterium sp. TaxID=1871047 RepID=UPI0011C8C6B3|nr:DUF1648 domain-containing protein [Chryseobacterium sp.]TXF77246.1 DUF1648 domain-containing protein [Chryseobacterium sp.]